MKILIDENVDQIFSEFLPNHEAFHVNSMGWQGTKNGALMNLTEQAGFEVFITSDKNLRHQQNLQVRRFAIFVLDAHPNTLANQVACIPILQSLLLNVVPGSVTVVEGPHPKRTRA